MHDIFNFSLCRQYNYSISIPSLSTRRDSPFHSLAVPLFIGFVMKTLMQTNTYFHKFDVLGEYKISFTKSLFFSIILSHIMVLAGCHYLIISLSHTSENPVPTLKKWHCNKGQKDILLEYQQSCLKMKKFRESWTWPLLTRNEFAVLVCSSWLPYYR